VTEPVSRIAMWSGPRNISTAMMRAFENRADSVVWDEPFYAAYLALTRIDHPMRDQVIAAGPADWRDVVAGLIGPLPGPERVFYQKHMTHHMIERIDRSWINRVTSCFLIRAPEQVLASYTKKREDVALADIGFVAQAEIFDRVADRLGEAPPVIDAEDVLKDPRGSLSALCAACAIPFDAAMLAWPAGRRASDGVWAAHWYATVESSTGFAPYREREITLAPGLAAIAEEARGYYERLRPHRIGVASSPLSSRP
jgi:hypothetical protein